MTEIYIIPKDKNKTWDMVIGNFLGQLDQLDQLGFLSINREKVKK
jgi:hypothetical protein